MALFPPSANKWNEFYSASSSSVNLSTHNCMITWLTDCMIFFIDKSIGWLNYWETDWFVDKLINLLTDWLIDWSIDHDWIDSILID